MTARIHPVKTSRPKINSPPEFESQQEYVARLSGLLQQDNVSGFKRAVNNFSRHFNSPHEASQQIYALFVHFKGSASHLCSIWKHLLHLQISPSADFFLTAKLYSNQVDIQTGVHLRSAQVLEEVINWWSRHGWSLCPPKDQEDFDLIMNHFILPPNLTPALQFVKFLTKIDELANPLYKQAIADNLWLNLLCNSLTRPQISAVLRETLKRGYDLPPRTMDFPLDNNRTIKLSYLSFCFLENNVPLQETFLAIPERRADLLADLRRYAPHLLGFDGGASFLPYLVEAKVDLLHGSLLRKIFSLSEKIVLPLDLATYLESHAHQVIDCVDAYGVSCFSAWQHSPSCQLSQEPLIEVDGNSPLLLSEYHNHLKKLALGQDLPTPSLAMLTSKRM